ncbi:MAG TPA: TolC family protein [Gemmatimonadaceae bacterium]|jgi:outer membrane protein|nr:TolC family protein [Gemmatimonadaceae bacterium]
MIRPLIAAVFPLLAASSLAVAQRSDTLQLSLPNAVSIALTQADEIRLSRAQTEIADASVGVARASALPQLRLNSTYSHAWENARANAVGQVFNQPNTYNANLAVTQTFFQGGRIVAGLRGAADTRSATLLDAEEVRNRLMVDVQRAYLQVLYTNRIVGLQEQNLELATERAKQVEQFEKAGRAARYDVLRANVERANIEPLVIQAQNDRELAILDLKRLLNVPVTRPVVLTTRVDSTAAEAMVAALVDTALAPNRSAVRSAELAVQSRREGITIARADLLPTVSLTFNNGYQAFPPLGFGFPTARGTAANEFCPVGSSATTRCQNGGWFTDRSMTATISLPIFDGMRARSNIDLARAQEQLAETQLQLSREAVALEVARARAELTRARTVAGARHQNSLDAREAFQLASLRFNRGLSTQLEVSDAQLALLTAESTEARATYDVYLAAAEMARALGRPIPLPAMAGSSGSSDTGASREP